MPRKLADIVPSVQWLYQRKLHRGVVNRSKHLRIDGYTDNFLEAWTGDCSGSPEGRWEPPFYYENGVWVNPPGVNGSDSGQPGECGRSWIDSSAIRVKLIQP